MSAQLRALNAEGIGRGSRRAVLLGEAYDRRGPAILLALGDGCSALAEFSACDCLTIKMFRTTVYSDRGERLQRDSNLSRSFAAILDCYDAERRPVAVTVSLELLEGVHLGAHAALATAIIRALDSLLGVVRTDAELVEMLHAWRSPNDTARTWDTPLAMLDQVALYLRGPVPVRIRAHASMSLVLAGTHWPGQLHRFARDATTAQASQQRVTAAGSVVRAAVKVIEAGDLERLGQLMGIWHRLSQSSPAPSRAVEELCQQAQTAGALGATVTGRMGCAMIALARDRSAALGIAEALAQAGGKCRIIDVADTTRGQSCEART